MVELRTLAYFVTTCRAGSFARAAAELDIAVSTLSTTLKALGQDLDITLFRRSNNMLYPTSAARALMRAAEPLLIAEMFARRHTMASTEARLKHLVVEINLSFTIGGISKALRLAIDRMATTAGSRITLRVCAGIEWQGWIRRGARSGQHRQDWSPANLATNPGGLARLRAFRQIDR